MSVTGPGKCDVREGPTFNPATARGLVVHVASISSSGIPASTLTFRTNVTDSVTSEELLAESDTRQTWSVFNDSPVALYLAIGIVDASITNFTAIVQPGGYYEPPAAPIAWRQAVQGIWPGATGAGAARISAHFP